ncbi:hypothetical protein Pst134EA_015896 [Puccinia striiformis f. sp. tritici]|uniref:hypothetical protein n=1 Tax=Puccinia striiformis f. sp. tritici TaxID=168172 RepID=UPI000A12731A|nr:hypothetical protein Pst134EA_015896 [Puccinia striiformis f. sp. tritici]KAH9463815.1 hypothetical protein Pst134EA_015896 [Puccinia striiformis f. sp. tritici]
MRGPGPVQRSVPDRPVVNRCPVRGARLSARVSPAISAVGGSNLRFVGGRNLRDPQTSAGMWSAPVRVTPSGTELLHVRSSRIHTWLPCLVLRGAKRDS